MTWKTEHRLKQIFKNIKCRDLTGEALRAYRSWGQQRSRCTNPNVKNYAWYGAKGVRVEYGCREFVEWWVKEAKRIGKKGLVCDRINSKKNYKFGNIQLISRSENGKRMERAPKYRPIIWAVGPRTFKTVHEAAEITGYSASTIYGYCNGSRKPTKKENTFSFGAAEKIRCGHCHGQGWV